MSDASHIIHNSLRGRTDVVVYQTGLLRNASLMTESLVKPHHERLNLRVDLIPTMPHILALHNPSSKQFSLS